MTDLRISVTDRCNYRCTYCMPEAVYDWIKRDEILSFEEVARLARIFVNLGVERIRLTGGEPLVRKDLHHLIRLFSEIPGLNDVSLTTNGALLAEQIQDLTAAGLRRINVSLDTLNPEKFRKITQWGELAPVLEGLEAAKRCRVESIKINAVIIRDFNDDEIPDLASFGRDNGFMVRFIEFMDVGNANRWSLEKMAPKSEILAGIQRLYPVREIGRADGHAPAVDYEYLDGRSRVGIIGSVTEPFCGSCDRVRLTPDGKFVTCLFSSEGRDLKTPLRCGATDEQLASLIREIWSGRNDRYSEDRWRALQSGMGYDSQAHPKIEMIRLGG